MLEVGAFGLLHLGESVGQHVLLGEPPFCVLASSMQEHGVLYPSCDSSSVIIASVGGFSI